MDRPSGDADVFPVRIQFCNMFMQPWWRVPRCRQAPEAICRCIQDVYCIDLFQSFLLITQSADHMDVSADQRRAVEIRGREHRCGIAIDRHFARSINDHNIVVDMEIRIIVILVLSTDMDPAAVRHQRDGLTVSLKAPCRSVFERTACTVPVNGLVSADLRSHQPSPYRIIHPGGIVGTLAGRSPIIEFGTGNGKRRLWVCDVIHCANPSSDHDVPRCATRTAGAPPSAPGCPSTPDPCTCTRPEYRAHGSACVRPDACTPRRYAAGVCPPSPG